MTTVEIIEQLRKIDNMKNEINEETGEFLYTEDDINAEVAKLEGLKEEKLNAIEDYKRKLKKDIEFYDEKKKKQEANIKKAKASIEYMKSLQESLLGGEKLKTDEYTFSYRVSEKVIVEDVEQLLPKFYKIEKKPIASEIKKAIKEAEKNKESFFGATIERNKSLSVR